MPVCAAVGFGADGITSQNVVGYINKSDIKAKSWTILGTAFETMAGGAVNINEFITGTFDKTVSSLDDDFTDRAPQLQIKDPVTGNTTICYYVKDAWWQGHEPDEVEGWCNEVGNYIPSLTLSAGTGFWFWNSSDCNVTFAGQVVGDSTSEVTVYPIWSLISNPFPTEVNLNQVGWTGIDSSISSLADDFTDTAPQIQVKSASGTAIYYYVKDAWWQGHTPDEVEGWCNEVGNYVENPMVGLGCGFWFRPTGAKEMSVVFSR